MAATYTLKSESKKLREGVREDPIVFLVDAVLYAAIELRASDIHFEPMANKVRVRYRIDGVLYDRPPIPREQGPLALSRLKILASLDIAQRRLPQDGKLMLRLLDDERSSVRSIDLRVSTFPVVFGEKVVVRILDRKVQHLALDALGCSGAVLKTLHELLERPHGFFLVTGPTGSGKTTTLYAMLSELNRPERNIVTMEDPVEYQISGITQSQINEKVGFTFERGLRSVLRQDPDVVMVGEIRDVPTAQIAIEAALTGHLIVSTLHTKDSVGALTRLLDMGIEPFLLAASISAVLAQRLVRRLCQSCQGAGCPACDGLGHKGRVGIFEVLVVDDTIRSLLLQRASESEIRAHLSGTSLRDDGMTKVERGLVSREELARVLC